MKHTSYFASFEVLSIGHLVISLNKNAKGFLINEEGESDTFLNTIEHCVGLLCGVCGGAVFSALFLFLFLFFLL